MSANDKQIGGDHYKGDLEHWDMIEDHGIGYLEGCATKYVARWRKKDGLKDLRKSRHYVEKLLEKNETGRWSRGEVPAEVIAEFSAANGLNDLETEIVYLLTEKWSINKLEIALRKIDQLIADAPVIDPMMELANTIIDACNNYDVQTTLTVLSNVVGQCVAAMAEATPAKVIEHVGNFAAAVHLAANKKLMYDVRPKGAA